ncbi:LON peptidase substrate-binding domain-containing protein [Nannocystis pusilla]
MSEAAGPADTRLFYQSGAARRRRSANLPADVLSRDHRAAPLLPLRGAIILPGATQPVDLGRSSPAMQAVRAAQDRARGGAGRVIAVLLRDTSAATPDLDQLYPVAIACEVVQVLAGTPAAPR